MNKEPAPTSKTPMPTIPKQDRLPKRWMVAKQKFGHTRQQLDNETAEAYYHSVLYKVKLLLKDQEPLVFEKDCTCDNSQNAFTLHAFMSDSVYLYAECDFCYKYQVEYAFKNCRHEEAIRGLLNAFVLQGRVKEVALQPGFTSFYESVLAFQPATFVYKLKR